MLRNLITITLWIILIGCEVSFSQQKGVVSVAGIFQGEEYVNAALGFRFKVPSKWFVPTDDQIAKYVEEGLAQYRTGDPAIDSAAGRQEKVEFAVSKKKVGKPENAVMGYSLTRQQNLSFTAKMIAEAMRNQISKVPEFTLSRDVSVERLGNRDFLTFEMGVVGFPKQRVRVYVTRVKEYALTFGLTYWDDESLKVMLDSLNTIKFDD